MDVRRVFFCWDEFVVKVIFDVILVVLKNRVVFFNMVSLYFLCKGFVDNIY